MKISEAVQSPGAQSRNLSLQDRAVVGFLALLLGFSAVDKLLHYQGFVNAINDYRALPLPLGTWLAPIVIAAELSAALGLLWSPWRRRAALQSAVLMTVFTAALAVNYLLGARGVCGCWFSLTMAQGNLHFLLNGILIALSLLVWHASEAPRRAGQTAEP